MTNREKYITKRDEYDLMMTIAEAYPNVCPIDAIGGNYVECENELPFGKCADCIQQWLNEEADQPKPQWHDSLMKNFLRKG